MKSQIITWLMIAGVLSASCDIRVDANIPAGNIIVGKVSGDVVTVRPDMRDTSGDWFYWAFRVTGAAGRTVKFNFKGAYDGNVVGTRGPVVSLDKGKSWAYPLDGKCARNGFSYSFPHGADEVWFYECHPYHQSNWEAFLAKHEAVRGKYFETSVLCKSKKGRDVEKARFGCLKNAKYTMMLSSRHHASEAVATYALEGFLEAVLADDELGEWLRKNVDVMVVPFMDKDGVVDGDQGKNRKPHDHNRDYSTFIYPETKATVDWIKNHTDNKLDLWIDLHCPWIRGEYNEYVYSPLKNDVNKRNAVAEKKFDALLAKLQCGSLKYKVSDDLSYGKAWNNGGYFKEGWTCIYWAINTLPVIKLGHTFEIPFATANGAVVTPEKIRDFGRDIAKALRAYLIEEEVGVNSIRGPFPLLCTPWTADGALDCEVLAKEAEFMDKCGAAGIVWPTAGEVSDLVSEGEYVKGLDALAACAAKPDFKARLTAICCGATAKDALNRVADVNAVMGKHGVKMAILARPPDDAKTQNDMEVYYRNLAKVAKMPVIIQTYNGKSPQPDVKLLVQLAKDYPDVYGYVKEESPGGQVNMRIARLVAAKPVIKTVFSGWGAKGWLYQGRTLGTGGIITQRPAYSDLLAKMWVEEQTGDPDGKLSDLYSKYLLMINLGDTMGGSSDMMRGPHLYVLKKRGVFTNTYTRRRPGKDDKSGKKWIVDEFKLTDSEKAEIERRMKYCGLDCR